MIRVDPIDRVRVRRAEEVPSGLPATDPRSPAVDYYRSTIGPAFVPDTHYMLPIINLYREMEGLVHREFGHCESDTNNALERLMAIDKKKIEIFQQRLQDCESKKTWSRYETVAQYIASTSGIVLGLGLLGSAPVAGILLVAGGGLGLVNRAFSDTIGWDCLTSRFTASVELQRKYAERIDMCFVCLSTTMSMAGTIGAYHAGTLTRLSFKDPHAIINKAMKIWTLAGVSLQGLTKVGGAALDRKIYHLKEAIIKYDAKSFSARQEIHASSANLRRTLELSEKTGECIKQCIAASAT